MAVEELFRHIESKRERYLGFLKRLVEQPSVSATGEGIEECASQVAELLEEVGIRADIYRDHGGNPVVFGEIRAEAHATLMFYNHYDVQPPEPLDKWLSPPFTLAARNGKLYGRGAADNKGNIAARIAAVDSLLDTLGETPVNVKFLIEGEEEIGSPTLEKFCELHSDLLFADGCVWEYGYRNRAERPVIYLGVKGILYVELEAHGAATDLHSSWGCVVENPAWRLVKLLNTIRGDDGTILIDGFYDDVEKPGEELLSLLDDIDPAEVDVKELFGAEITVGGKRGKDALRALLLEPAVNICGIIAGYTGAGSKTVLPSRASTKLDFRLVPRQEPLDIFRKLENHIKKHGFTDISLNMVQGYPAARTAPDSPFVAAVAETARVAYGVEPVLYPSGAGSGPMYVITERLGIPCVSTGVGYPGSLAHAPNENIREQDFIAGIKHMALLMIRLHQYLH